MFLIITVCYIILFYVFIYLIDDCRIIEFLFLMYCFIFCILHTIIYETHFQLFLFWEFIDFISFLLISFWVFRVYALRAGLQALYFSKCGDLFLLYCFIIFFYSDSILLICFFIIFDRYCFLLSLMICDCFKTVYFFHIWLPQAMEGPTAVSSLLHSATLIILGILLWIFYIIFSFFIQLILVFGFSIVCYGSVIIFLFDLKLIAFSTASQLCFISICLLDLLAFSNIYILYYACFKALLFFNY